MAKNNNLTDYLTDLADAIRAKKGTSDPINPQNFSDEIASIETGGGSGGGGEGDVIFRDYDGKILHMFSASEFLAMSAMPELPTQQCLICQEWNWSLADAQSFVAENGVLEVGANYITDDGKTRLYINILTKARINVPIRFVQTSANAIRVDWGDGSEPQTYSGTTVSASHRYAEIGRYVISLEVLSGELKFPSSSSYCIMGATSTAGSRVYPLMLEKVEIGNNVNTIGTYAFYTCGISSISIPKGVIVASSAFQYSCIKYVAFPSGTIELGSGTFYTCRELENISIPASVSAIQGDAFRGCSALTKIIMPDKVTQIGGSAFNGCRSLEKVVLSKIVSSISSNVFYQCYSLKNISIPPSVKTIGESAFNSCSGLKKISLPSGLSAINPYTFYGCYALEEVSIPSSVATIGNYAFQECYSLKTIEIPLNVTSIGTYCFKMCENLRDIVFPPKVSTIGTYMLQNCYGLTRVVLPQSLTSIAANAFTNAKGVELYDFRACVSVPALAATSAFSGIASDCKIVVPDTLYDEWIAASNWTTYASKMVKASEYTD